MPDLPALLGGDPVHPPGPPPWPSPRLNADAGSVLARLCESAEWGRYHGPHGEALAGAMRDRLGAAAVRLCAGGTAAVELALRAGGVGAGDEVILSAYDFRACALSVLALGAVPVLVDVKPDDWQIDPARVAAAIGPETRAVLVSHLHGGLVDVEEVRTLCDDAGLWFVEDVCQAPGAVVAGRPAGAWGDAAAFSFGGSKPLTAGRGGAVVLHDPRGAPRLARHLDRGNDLSPLSELQAAVLRPQWDRLDEDTRIRGTNAAWLTAELSLLGGLTPLAPHPDDRTRPAFYKYGMKYDPRAFVGLSRERFYAAVRAEGVGLDPGFPAVHTRLSRRRCRVAGTLGHAEAAGRSCVVLHHPVLLEGGPALEAVPAAVAKVRRHADALREAAVPTTAGGALEL